MVNDNDTRLERVPVFNKYRLLRLNIKIGGFQDIRLV